MRPPTPATNQLPALSRRSTPRQLHEARAATDPQRGGFATTHSTAMGLVRVVLDGAVAGVVPLFQGLVSGICGTFRIHGRSLRRLAGPPHALACSSPPPHAGRRPPLIAVGAGMVDHDSAVSCPGEDDIARPNGCRAPAVDTTPRHHVAGRADALGRNRPGSMAVPSGQVDRVRHSKFRRPAWWCCSWALTITLLNGVVLRIHYMNSTFAAVNNEMNRIRHRQTRCGVGWLWCRGSR